MRRGGFFFELRRRRVWRVAGAYVLVVWMALEIILETADVVGYPAWLPRTAVFAAFLGFPVTLILAWVFDLTAHGVVRTPALDDEPAAPDGRPRPTLPDMAGDRARLAGVFGAGIIVALVGFGAYSAIHPTPGIRPETIQAIAVLPLADLSPSRDQGYFADGVTEELINRLGRVSEVRVVGRTSAFAVRDRGASLAEISRELGVDAVVEGSVRRSGQRLRVSVELVDAATGFQIWSETYDRTADDIFAIQDDIAGAIVGALRVQLQPGASRWRAGTESVRAHDAYLLGLARWNARTEDDLLQALDFFTAAVEEDPTYAPAQAGLALTYAVLPWYADIPTDVATERGLDAAARALALDAQNPEAHAAIGQIAQALDWNLEAAETAYRRALDVQPSYATGHQWYAETLLIMGRLEEARSEIERAIELDPLSVAGRYVQAYRHVLAREFDSAQRAYERLLQQNPGYVLGHAALVDLCLVAGCLDVAHSAATAAYPPPLAGAAQRVVAVARDRQDPDARAAALKSLRSLHGRVDPTRLALLHAAIGDHDGALQRIEQAYAEGEDPNFLLALVHPLFDPLRRDPRFLAITRAVGAEAPLSGVAAR